MDDPASHSMGTYLVLMFLLSLSFLFSGSEVAVFRVDPLRLRNFAEAGDQRVKRLQRLLARPQALLSTLLLGNTAVNIGASTIITAAFLSRYEQLWSSRRIELTATLVSTALILVFGEVSPKTLVGSSPTAAALGLAGVLEPLVMVFRPVAFLLEGITNWLVRAMGRTPQAAPLRVTTETVEVAIDLGREQGALEDEETTMIHGYLDTDETKVREIMTPRPDVARISADARISQAADIILSTGYSRLPVYGRSVDDIVGVVYVKDLLPLLLAGQLEGPVGPVARTPYLVPETKAVSDLLRELRERGEALAVVVDEYGGTSGVATLEDVVEEIVGEIADEFDRSEFSMARIPGGYVFSARTLIEDVNEEYGLNLPVPEDVETLGGLVYSLADAVPELGASFTVNGWRLTVEELRGSRILRVRVQALDDGTEPSLAETVAKEPSDDGR